jgi:hypothetical protein
MAAPQIFPPAFRLTPGYAAALFAMKLFAGFIMEGC